MLQLASKAYNSAARKLMIRKPDVTAVELPALAKHASEVIATPSKLGLILHSVACA